MEAQAGVRPYVLLLPILSNVDTRGARLKNLQKGKKVLERRGAGRGAQGGGTRVPHAPASVCVCSGREQVSKGLGPCLHPPVEGGLQHLHVLPVCACAHAGKPAGVICGFCWKRKLDEVDLLTAPGLLRPPV